MKTKLKALLMNRKLVAAVLTAAMAVSATALTPTLMPDTHIPVISNLFGGTTTQDAEPVPFRCGDLDGDGDVDIFDTLETLKYIVNMNSTITHIPASWEGVDNRAKARRASILTTAKREGLDPTDIPDTVGPDIFDTLETLKYIVNMDTQVMCENGCDWDSPGGTPVDTTTPADTSTGPDETTTPDPNATTGTGAETTTPSTTTGTGGTETTTPSTGNETTTPSTGDETTTPSTGDETTTPSTGDETTTPSTGDETTTPSTGDETTTPSTGDETTTPSTGDETTTPSTGDETTTPSTGDETTTPSTGDETTTPDTNETTIPSTGDESTTPDETTTPEETTTPAATTLPPLEGVRPDYIPAFDDSGERADGNPDNTPFVADCEECGVEAELCPGCGYCADCDWIMFGILHCRGCGFGTDCIASAQCDHNDGECNGAYGICTSETDPSPRAGFRNDWNGEHFMCQGCLEADEEFVPTAGRISWSGFSTITPVQGSTIVCVFFGQPHSTCTEENSTDIADCAACPISDNEEENLYICITCTGVRYGIVVCRGCSRHSDCISGVQNAGEGSPVAEGWCDTCGNCKVEEVRPPFADPLSCCTCA